jgi:hypothetical protein
VSWLDLTGDKANTVEAIKPGYYDVIVDEAKVKATKDSQGEFIEMTLKVTDGEFKGRKIYHRFNIKNKSEKAQSIGRSELKTFLMCAGHGVVLENITELVGLKTRANVKIETKDGQNYPRIGHFKSPVATTTTTTTQATVGGF